MTADSHADAVLVRGLLVAIVKYALLDAEDITPDLEAPARRAQSELRARHGDAVPPSVHLDAQWELAVEEAEADQRLNHSGVSLTLPQMLPFDATLLMASPVDLNQLRDRVRGAAATGSRLPPACREPGRACAPRWRSCPPPPSTPGSPRTWRT